MLAFSAACVASGGMPVSVNGITSSSINISWPSAGERSDVYISPEPSFQPRLLVASNITGGEYTIRGIAAGTDVFIRVESRGSHGDARAKTAGGQRSSIIAQTGIYGLDTPLKEISAYAPDVLELVLHDREVWSYTPRDDVLPEYGGDGGIDTVLNYTGFDWQSGTWTVRRLDGSEIKVSGVYRNSVPSGTHKLDLGYRRTWYLNRPDVDHHIFLALGEDIGRNEILNITHNGSTAARISAIGGIEVSYGISQRPANISFLFPFSDAYTETPVIKLNQVGYSPAAVRRWAYVSGWIGDGGPLNLSGFPAEADVLSEPPDPMQPMNEIMAGLNITQRSAFDNDAGSEVREIDLSQMPESDTARYRIRIKGVGVSWPTMVSDIAVFKAFYTSARGLYHNRWCGDLGSDYTEWVRPLSGNFGRLDHCQAYTSEVREGSNRCSGFPFCENDPKAGLRTVKGGHHDAGDFDIRSRHILVPAMLMRVYEMNSAAFADRQLAIPESGNGIPDFLDEILWNIAGWEDLQESDGGVRSGAESWRHPWNIYYANEDPLPYWAYSRDAEHTLNAAGIFAQASLLTEPYDKERAAGLKRRAIDAYDYASPSAPSGPALFAAGELYRLTGNEKYRKQFEATWKAYDKFGRGAFDSAADFWWGGAPKDVTLPMHSMGYARSSGANSSIAGTSLRIINQKAGEHSEDLMNDSAFRHKRKGLEFGDATAAGKWMEYAYLALESGNLTREERQEYTDALSLTADYMLGANPLGMSYITGLGSVYPQDVLHLDSLASMRDRTMEPLPGLPVFGFVESVPNAYGYDFGKILFHPAITERPVLMRYADMSAWPATSEFDVIMQAQNVRLFASLLPDGMMPPVSWLPGYESHRSPLPVPGPVDVTPPSPPAGVKVSDADGTTRLEWNPSSDPETRIIRYKIYRNGAPAGTANGTSFLGTDDGVASHEYEISSVNAAFIESGRTSIMIAPPPAPSVQTLSSGGGGSSVPLPGPKRPVENITNTQKEGITLRIMSGIPIGAGNMSINVTKTLNITPPPGIVHKYIEVSHQFSDSDIRSAEMTFSVPVKWLEENNAEPADVNLMRHAPSGWEKISIAISGWSGTEVTYKSTLSGLSVFAVTVNVYGYEYNLTFEEEIPVTAAPPSWPVGTAISVFIAVVAVLAAIQFDEWRKGRKPPT